jgi:hypothetical protein
MNAAPQLEGLGHLGGQPEGLVEGRQGLRVLAEAQQGGPAAAIRAGVVGLPPDRLVAVGDGAVVLSHAGEGNPAEDVGLGQVRIAAQRFCQLQDGDFVVASVEQFPAAPARRGLSVAVLRHRATSSFGLTSGRNYR